MTDRIVTLKERHRRRMEGMAEAIRAIDAALAAYARRHGGPSRHGDLVRRLGTPLPGARPALLEPTAPRRAVTNLLGFRHVAMQLYDAFDLDRGALAIRDAEVFLSMIVPAFARFRAEIDPD